MRKTDDEDLEVYELNVGRSPSVAVVSAVAEQVDRSAVEMEPLAETVSTDALNEMIRRADEDDALRVGFDYSGCRITVTPTEVLIDPPE